MSSTRTVSDHPAAKARQRMAEEVYAESIRATTFAHRLLLTVAKMLGNNNDSVGADLARKAVLSIDELLDHVLTKGAKN